MPPPARSASALTVLLAQQPPAIPSPAQVMTATVELPPADPGTPPHRHIQAAQHRKVTHMTTPVTAQPRHPLIRWATAPFRALRHLHQELLGAGEAMARSSRFLQACPQAGPAEAKHARPASVSKALTRT